MPVSSVPTCALRDHCPRLSEASAAATRRASANISASVCSAAATALPPGAFTTTMPRAVAASTSMVSTPAPARPITRSRGADSSRAAVTLVSLRTSSASAVPRRRSSAARSPATNSRRARCPSRDSPSWAIGSATSTSGSWPGRGCCTPSSRGAARLIWSRLCLAFGRAAALPGAPEAPPRDRPAAPSPCARRG